MWFCHDLDSCFWEFPYYASFALERLFTEWSRSKKLHNFINNTDQVVGVMFNKLDNSWVTGICMMGLFAAGMSSLASVILIAGTSIVKDIWHSWKPMADRKIVAGTQSKYADVLPVGIYFHSVSTGRCSGNVIICRIRFCSKLFYKPLFSEGFIFAGVLI